MKRTFWDKNIVKWRIRSGSTTTDREPTDREQADHKQGWLARRAILKIFLLSPEPSCPNLTLWQNHRDEITVTKLLVRGQLTWVDQKSGPGLACNLDFAEGKGLEPKVENFSKIVKVERRGEQTGLTQTYHRLGHVILLLGDFL